MPIICPTVTAFNNHQYRAQIERLVPFARRVHIDLMDGEFAPSKSPALAEVWWPDELIADIHLMYQRPMEQLNTLIKLKPNLVVIHAEAEADFSDFAVKLHAAGIKVGLALLQDTSVDQAAATISDFDHVLVFSGNLGYHGGEADLGLLDKVRELRERYPRIEISWDGGISDQNAKQLVDAGIDVLNVGGFIQKSAQPKKAYSKLEELLNN
jgi:ribulose-phosphate 3-epimerase